VVGRVEGEEGVVRAFKARMMRRAEVESRPTTTKGNDQHRIVSVNMRTRRTRSRLVSDQNRRSRDKFESDAHPTTFTCERREQQQLAHLHHYVVKRRGSSPPLIPLFSFEPIRESAMSTKPS